MESKIFTNISYVARYVNSFLCLIKYTDSKRPRNFVLWNTDENYSIKT